VSPVTTPRSSNGSVGSTQCGTEIASGLRAKASLHVVLHRPKKPLRPVNLGFSPPCSSPPAIQRRSLSPWSRCSSVAVLCCLANPTAAPGPSLPRLLHRRLTRRLIAGAGASISIQIERFVRGEATTITINRCGQNLLTEIFWQPPRI